MGLLSKVVKGRMRRPPRVLLYGPPGIGKTTFGASTRKPIFVCTEDGADEIEADRFPLARCYDDVVAALGELRGGKHGYETVVIDSLDWLERLIHDRVCSDYDVNSIERADGGYARGYTHALTHWREVLAHLDALRADGMVIVLLAHSKVERVEDPEMPAYDRHGPRIHKGASALVTEWCDAVLFATRRVAVRQEDVGFGKKRTTAVGVGKAGGDRIMRVVGGPACLAKNRYGLTDDLPLEWSAFEAALQTSEE